MKFTYGQMDADGYHIIWPMYNTLYYMHKKEI